MPRPRKERLVKGCPNSNYFKPAGIPKFELDEIILTKDEFESIRLKDFERLDQTSSAKEMGVSQPTFHRLVDSARKKIADAIVNGKAILLDFEK